MSMNVGHCVLRAKVILDTDAGWNMYKEQFKLHWEVWSLGELINYKNKCQRQFKRY